MYVQQKSKETEVIQGRQPQASKTKAITLICEEQRSKSNDLTDVTKIHSCIVVTMGMLSLERSLAFQLGCIFLRESANKKIF